MKAIILPPDSAGKPSQQPPRRPGRLYTLLGGNGSGKSLFMREIALLNKGDAYYVSAVTGGMPGRVTGSLTQHITVLSLEEEKVRFNVLKSIWEDTFPGNKIDIVNGKPQIRNRSGKDTIGIRNLSRGEKAALYYIAAVLLAPENALILVDSPTLFLHPTIVGLLWDRIERTRTDCRFVYDTYDANFASSQTRRTAIWIKDYNASDHSWRYQIISDGELPDEIFLQMIGSRKPILFTEGDTSHSIDIRLYSVVFPEFTVKPLGSCDKVIESTRTMQSLKTMHRIDSYGLVDRDRRSEQEVEYLRAKHILVPDVAEIENIFLSPGVVMTMAEIRGRNPKKVLKAVRQEVMHKFEDMLENQALQHTRHRMKRDVERKIDARFTCITALELHIKSLIKKLKPRETYDQILAEFKRLSKGGDYEGVLRVFNHKPMFTGSCVAKMLGFSNIDDYVAGVISTLKHGDDQAERLRLEIRKLFT
ncbi:MAG: DUF4435 domain-containing protein [Muribaculaceae bacterium]|nr:DUF4435 domain-containing protein [Muribaculaceae bacterium]MDE6523178.1 DUF4435 domain-containing protein [Muribaculaceae bacterium]